MGFLRRLFGAKTPTTSTSSPSKQKRRWSFTRSTTTSQPNKNHDTSRQVFCDDNSYDATKHAIAVATATTAVAEAALAAAHAAAEVVRLTNGGGGRCASAAHARGFQHLVVAQVAAVKIQSAFRGYLARRALRALKALVKLQALVRGYIVRKQTREMLRRMQMLVRLQARVRATRSKSSISLLANRHRSSSQSHNPRYPRWGSTSNFGDMSGLDKAKLGPNWLDHWMEGSIWSNHSITLPRSRKIDDEKGDKILEVDTCKPQMTSKQTDHRIFQATRHALVSDQHNQHLATLASPSKLATKQHNRKSSAEDLYLSFLKMPVDMNPESSPYGLSASSRPGSSGRRGPFTPRSECAWSLFNGYQSYPNYMANTESSRAKVRSQSAPKQRLEFEKYSGMRSFQRLPDIDTISERGFVQYPEYRSKAYLPSGCLNRLGSTNRRR